MLNDEAGTSEVCLGMAKEDPHGRRFYGTRKEYAMFKANVCKLVVFLSLLVSMLAGRASAQFEVPPDHFDSPAKKQAAQRRAAKPEKSTARATGHAATSAPVTARKRQTSRKGAHRAALPRSS